MKIIHIILGKANPNRMNGVNKVVNDLATNQINAGLNVEVWGITLQLNHDYPERNYPTKLFSKHPFYKGLDKQLVDAIKSLNTSAVFHIHGGFIFEMFLISKLLKQLHIPFVFMPHGAYNQLALKKNQFIKTIYFNLFERQLLNACTRIHLIGESEKVGLSQIYSIDKVSLIPYGFECILNQDTTAINNNKFIITYCGRLDVKNKGLQELISGFDTFYKSNKNAELHIIGDSSERVALEKYAQQFSARENIIFYGAKYANEKIELLKESHVFALTSLNEGLPASVLEAASLGIPSLLTQACNLTNVMNTYQAGYVIDKTDAHLIANGITYLYDQLITQNLLNQYKTAAVRMIENEFSWTKTIRELNLVYQNAC